MIAMTSDELYNRALHYLSLREYSQQELRQKLCRLSDDASLIEQVLQELSAKHLQSDERYAEMYVMSYQSKYGTLRLMHGLKNKGISEEIIQQYLFQNQEKENELQRAVLVLQKKFRQPENQINMKQKYARFLAYRGFDSSVCYQAIRLFIQGADEI